MNIRKIYLPHRLNSLCPEQNKLGQLLPQVHHRLKSLGFYHGPEHNLYDSNTRDAILKFQEANNLSPTGVLDPVTYCHLYGAQTIEITPREKEDRAYSALPNANILITKSSRQLTLFNGKNPFRQYPIAIGKPSTPTPEGNYAIATQITNPGGILGTRWMGLNYDAYGIHGTTKPWLIGQMVSNGCIRMNNHHVEELFILVRIGTPVFIRS